MKSGHQLKVVAHLAPCQNYEGIRMKLYAKKKAKHSQPFDYIPDPEDCDENGALKWRLGDSVVFPESSSSNTSDPDLKNEDSLEALEKFFTEHEYRNTIILGGAGLGLAGVLVAMVTCCVMRRRRTMTNSYDL